MSSPNTPVNTWVQTTVLSFLALFLMAIIFILDLNVPVGVAIGAMYSIVILYSWILPKPVTPAIVGMICSVLIVVVFVNSAQNGSLDHAAGINRIISLLVVWICVSMMTIAKRSFEQIETAKSDLEFKIQERTHELRQNEASLKQAQKVAKTGSWEWYPDTNKVVWSDQMYEIFGINPKQHTGFVHDIYQFIHPDDIEMVRSVSAQAAEEKRAIPIEYRVVAESNQIKYVRGDGDVMVDESGNMIKMFGTIQDITNEYTNQQQLEVYAKSLESKNKELEQFAYIASHDLQEPLRTLISISELFEQKYKGKLDEQADKLMHYIRDASKRMSALVKGLMDYSRIGKTTELTEVDCNTIVNEVQVDLANKIKETNAQIVVDQLPKIKGYEVELRLLFQNLISNGLKFQKEGVTPVIRISAEKTKQHWKLLFQDNGVGIGEEHKERIFTIFQRLHNKNEYEGTGIGLAHCQKIIDLHGGKIWVESKVGEGSTFFVVLPTDQD